MSALPDAQDVYGKRNYRYFKDQLAQRVGARRFKHSVNVAKCAFDLAQTYDYEDARKAKMAGILHDWDKGLEFDQLCQRARDLAVDVHPLVIERMPWLLHGPTAAAALRIEYPELGDDVFSAIARHTSGAADMQPLDSIIYISDIIEPNRTFGDQEGIAHLRSLVGAVELDQLYFEAFKYTFTFLVNGDKLLHPASVDIWNDLMEQFGPIREFRAKGMMKNPEAPQALGTG